MVQRIIALSGIFFFSSLLHAKPTQGIVYEMGSEKSKKLFTLERIETLKGPSKIVQCTYFTPAKSVGAREEVSLLDGKIQKYSVHYQNGEEGNVEVKDGKLFFTYKKKDKVKTDEEDLTDTFMVAPLLPEYFFVHKDLLWKGSKLSVRLAVLERKETVAFTVEKMGEKEENGVDTIILKMEPKSPFMTMAVKPIYFVLRLDNFHPIQISGRTLPKILKGKDWEDLDAETVYKD